MPAAGEQWNQFTLLQPLGQGGMGEVFLAQDTDLNRKVALKVLAQELQQDPTARERLLREARSAAALDHPYICKIYEIGDADGKTFVAMEYVEGVTLQQKLRAGPVPLDDLLRMGAEITEAVEAAHQKQLLHRDLKTPNIMVTPDGHVKVMDFGLALQMSMEPGRESKVETLSGRLTSQGSTPGTVIYMSPEQVRGEPLDARSDVFSLGVVLYEMATGFVPFEGATSGLTYDAILNRGPTPPRELNRKLPLELEQVIGKSLEKDRELRYQQAKELLVDLRRLMRGADGSGSHPAVTFTFHERAERKSYRAWLVTAVAAIAAVALAVVTFWPSSPPSTGDSIPSLAVLPFENSRNDPQVDYLSDGIPETLVNRLSQLRQLQVMARSKAFRYRGPDVDPQTVGRELGVTAVLTGRVVQQGDALNVQAELVDVEKGTQLWGEQYNRRLADIFELQNDIATEISQALRLQLSGEDAALLAQVATSSSEAYRAYLRGRHLWRKRTNPDFKRAIDHFEDALEKDPAYAPAYSGLADCYVLLGMQIYGVDEDYPPREAVDKARDAALEALRLDENLGEARATLGWIRFLRDWDWDGAEGEFRRAVALDPSYGTAHQWYSAYLSFMGRHQEAIAEARRAVELEPTPLSGRFLGFALVQSGEYPEAIEVMERTVEQDPTFPLVRLWLLYAYWLNGMEDRAIAEAEKLDEGVGRFFRLVRDGKRAEAKELLRSTVDPKNLFDGIGYFALAGDEETVFARLEQAFRERHPQLPTALITPFLDPLRSHPRFVDLRRRMGLPETADAR